MTPTLEAHLIHNLSSLDPTEATHTAYEILRLVYARVGPYSTAMLLAKLFYQDGHIDDGHTDDEKRILKAGAKQLADLTIDLFAAVQRSEKKQLS